MSNKVQNEQGVIDPQTFEPTTEAERFSFDLGHEQGWNARNDELLDKIEVGLESLIAGLKAFLGYERGQR